MKDPTLVSRKVAVLGYRAVGKSSLTNSFVHGSFLPTYDPTIESTFHKTIRFRKVHFATDIVDTAGMVRAHAYYMLLVLLVNWTLIFYHALTTTAHSFILA